MDSPIGRRSRRLPPSKTRLPPFPDRAIVIVLDSVGVGALPDAAVAATKAATRSATSRGRNSCTSLRCGVSGSRASCICATSSRLPSRSAYGRMAEAPRRGLGHGTLGADGSRSRPRLPGVSEGFSRRPNRGIRATHRALDDRQPSSRPAPLSSTSSAPSTFARARPSSTRRPTACFRLRRTKRSSPFRAVRPAKRPI